MIIDFNPPPKVQIKCSFCDKVDTQVEHMVNNQLKGKEAKAICSECIEKCTNLFKETK